MAQKLPRRPLPVCTASPAQVMRTQAQQDLAGIFHVRGEPGGVLHSGMDIPKMRELMAPLVNCGGQQPIRCPMSQQSPRRR